MFTDATKTQSLSSFIITPVGFREWLIHFPNHGVMYSLIHIMSTLAEIGIALVAIIPFPWISDFPIL